MHEQRPPKVWNGYKVRVAQERYFGGTHHLAGKEGVVRQVKWEDGNDSYNVLVVTDNSEFRIDDRELEIIQTGNDYSFATSEP